MDTPSPAFIPLDAPLQDFSPPMQPPVAFAEGTPVREQFERARRAAMKFTDRVVEAGHANPRTAAAVLLGTGMVLGSLVYRLFQRPTRAQRITRALQRGAKSAGRSLISGLESARKLAM